MNRNLSPSFRIVALLFLVSAVGFSLFLPVQIALYAGAKTDRITVRKNYQGGSKSTAIPNRIIAAWGMTVGGLTNEHSLLYLGKSGDNTIEIESREVEKTSKTDKGKEIASKKISLFLECDGETICKVEELVFSMRVVGNTLHYTIVSDWDTQYLALKEKNKSCKNGHLWSEKDFLYCPTCGTSLKFAEGK